MILLGVTQGDINTAAIITLLVLILYFVSNAKLKFKRIGRDPIIYLNTRAKVKSIEYAPSAIITIDTEGIIIAWNGGATNIFGYTEREMMGQNLFKIIPERNRQRHMDGLKNARDMSRKSSMLGKTLDLSAIGKDGKEFPVRLTLWRWEDDMHVFYTGIVRNISEEKLLESKVSQLLEMYSLAEEIDDSGVWSWDVLNDIIYTSKGLDRLYGAEGNEKSSKFLLERVFHEDLAALEERIKENFEKKVPYESEYRIVTKDGRIVKVRVEGVPKLNQKGELISIIGTMHKI